MMSSRDLTPLVLRNEEQRMATSARLCEKEGRKEEKGKQRGRHGNKAAVVKGRPICAHRMKDPREAQNSGGAQIAAQAPFAFSIYG